MRMHTEERYRDSLVGEVGDGAPAATSSAGERPAPTPEALMRSRYTAFSLGTAQAVEYLVETHHPDHRDPKLREGLLANVAGVDAWEGLRVISASSEGDRGVVEFVATYRVGGQEGRLHERSEFVREDGRWFYTTGTIR